MTELNVGTANLYVVAVKRDADAVYDSLVAMMRQYHVVGAQEAGEAQHILDRLVRNRICKVYRGRSHPGGPSTPILYRNAIKAKGKTYPLTGRLWIGLPGAGISPWLKPKVLNTISFKWAGRRVTVANCHGPSSTYIPLRKRIAIRYYKKIATIIRGITGLVYLTGDFNQKPGDVPLQPLAEARMKSSQAMEGPIGTHGNRPIDDVKFRWAPRRLRLKKNRQHRAPSDHDYYGVDTEIIPND